MPETKKKLVNRRNFLDILTKVTALGSLSLSPLSVLANKGDRMLPGSEDEHCFLTQPYLQALNANQISIRWITGKPSYSWVEYGEGVVMNQKIHAVTDGLVDANNRVNEVVIEGLVPGRQYQYRVVSKEIVEFQPYKLTYGKTINTPAYSFSTINPAATEVRWLVLNDIHDRPKSYAELLKLNKEEPYDYVFLNGDMFDYQTDEKQIIDHLLTPCTDCFASVKPMLFVRGNHETRGKFARNLKDYFTNPGGQYFSYKWGPVFAIALDTGEDKEDDHPVYAGIVDFDTYREQQALWLEKQMQTDAYKKAKYRVVMMHIPPFYSGDWHGSTHVRKLFSPLFDKYKVDMVISGHTHKYGIHPPVSGTHNYPIIIGGGPTEGKRTLIKVKADAKSLQLRMLRDDATEIGNYNVDARMIDDPK